LAGFQFVPHGWGAFTVTDIVLDPLRWESVEAGDAAIVDAWLVSEGDHVRAGQPLARVLLAHECVEVPAPHPGMVEQLVVPAGDRFGAGHVLARLVTF
jgi:pyruvate dehydrogenase E2 component (dihydrolipoamide acetyltransferase)